MLFSDTRFSAAQSCASAMCLATVLSALGCSETAIQPCVTPIDVGITQPDDGREYLQGVALEIEANVRSLCGASYLEEAIYVVTSDVDGELGGELTIEEGQLSFHSDQVIALGPHTLTLHVASENSASGEDTVDIVVLENLPPTIEITSPTPEENDFETSVGATIRARVTDPAEPLDSLLLTWTLDGRKVEEGPAHADAEGNVTWVLESSEPGCRMLQVTVVDALDQTDDDEVDFVLWADPTDLDPFRWWRDEDEDGYGSPDEERTNCTAPDGAWFNPTLPDCNDDDDEVHPGRPDYCGDGINSDCNDLTPAGCYPTGSMAAELSDASITGAYDLVVGVGDVDGDTHRDIALGGNGFQLDIVSGPTFGTMTPSRSLTTANDYPLYRGSLGTAIAGGVDFDGNGINDLLLGNSEWVIQEPCAYSAGTAHLLLGSLDLQDDSLVTDPAITLAQAAPGDVVGIEGSDSGGFCRPAFFGSAVTWIPDIDGDQTPEFAIARSEDDGSEAGSVYVYMSSDASNIFSGPLTGSNYRLEVAGTTATSRLGASLAGADIDGDGIGDLLIGSVPTDPADTGAVYVIFGRDIPGSQASVSVTSMAGMTFTGAEAGALAGTSVTTAGDLDGDGDDEFLVAAPGARGGDGVVYLVPGFYEVNANYSLEDVFSESTAGTTRGAVRFVGAAGDALRMAKPAGDFNGDGHPDLLIGAPGNSFGDVAAGAAYVVYGGPQHFGPWWDSADGEPLDELLLETEVTTGTSVARFFSSVPSERLGHSVDRLGDIDEDGFDDLIIGANPTGGTVRVFFGDGT